MDEMSLKDCLQESFAHLANANADANTAIGELVPPEPCEGGLKDPAGPSSVLDLVRAVLGEARAVAHANARLRKLVTFTSGDECDAGDPLAPCDVPPHLTPPKVRPLRNPVRKTARG